jgi:hypothetical protein
VIVATPIFRTSCGRLLALRDRGRGFGSLTFGRADLNPRGFESDWSHDGNPQKYERFRFGVDGSGQGYSGHPQNWGSGRSGGHWGCGCHRLGRCGLGGENFTQVLKRLSLVVGQRETG